MGLPKTGTTFLQNHVFSSCPEIADFGKRPSYHLERPEVYHALRAVASAPEAEFATRLPQVRTALLREADASAVQKPRSSCRLLSYEGFFHPNSLHPIEIYNRLESIFGPLKVLLTIRHQFEWMASLYLYRFYRFLNGGGPSFDAWIARHRRRSGWNAFVCCDYWPVVEQLTARAGRDNVLVEPMEGLIRAQDPEALGRLASFLRVEVDALAEPFARGEPTKQGIDELGYLLGRTLFESRDADLSPEERLLLKRVLWKVHEQLHHRQQKATVAVDIVEKRFSETERASIRSGNTVLSYHLGLDLARFGYPLSEPSSITASVGPHTSQKLAELL
jgi:hypothetical protein